MRKFIVVSVVILVIVFVCYNPSSENSIYVDMMLLEDTPKEDYIRWVDFKVPYALMEQALKYDIDSKGKYNWIELISYIATKTGGEFSNYKALLLTELVKRINQGDTIQSLTQDMKYYPHYFQAYQAILGEFVGTYEVMNENGEIIEKYGLKVFSPIAKGYGYSDYKDFGVSRNFGYKRRHLGHDLMGSIGTPIIAVEGGIVEVMGWNYYGGWRIGIRSHDKKRYYYYAHLRKDHPFNYSISEGDTVESGDVIGYLGMTGYSTKENVNNMKAPHLHFGMQIIFDESQKEGNNEIWIDVYSIIKLLEQSRSTVYRSDETKDYYQET